MINAARSESVELDEPELFHLALHAMRADRHDEAMRLLKRTIQAFPSSARAHYLLGAEHAQVGLYDRAITEMAAAVELDSSLAAARFQLGLLQMTAGRAREAEAAWAPLDGLAADDPLRLFKTALLHLVRDEFALCIEGLRAGIAANTLNEDLNDDMRRLLADVEQRHPGAANESAVSGATPPVRIPAPSQRMLLSTYDRNRDDTTKD